MLALAAPPRHRPLPIRAPRRTIAPTRGGWVQLALFVEPTAEAGSRRRGVSKPKRVVPASSQLRLEPPPLPARPRTRGGCGDVPRPCPYVSCKHHLYLDVVRGRLVVNFPDIEPGEMPANRSCALDVADEGGLSLDDLEPVMNLGHSMISKIELGALARLRGDVEPNEEPTTAHVANLRERILHELKLFGVRGEYPTSRDLLKAMGIDAGTVRRVRAQRRLFDLVQKGHVKRTGGAPQRRKYWLASAPAPVQRKSAEQGEP